MVIPVAPQGRALSVKGSTPVSKTAQCRFDSGSVHTTSRRGGIRYTQPPFKRPPSAGIVGSNPTGGR